MVATLAALWTLLGLLAAATPDPVVPSVPSVPADPGAVVAARQVPSDGHGLVEFYQCNRCHEGGGLEAPTPDKACVGCHAHIEDGTFVAPADVLQRWQTNIVDLTAVPSLASIGQRLKRQWIREYLKTPHDLRPGLTAMMPRFAIDDAAALAIAQWLVPEEPTVPEDPRWMAWPSRGRRAMENQGCATCHALTGTAPLAISPVKVPLEKAALERGMMLAPDLRNVRERFRREALVAWLMDPSAQKPGTPMPKLNLSRSDAEDIAAFLLEVPLAAEEPKPVPERLPVLERRVTFKEVSARVFHRVCWHCHSEPDLALGDGGPGNTGGFGFAGRGVNLRDYASIMGGGLDDQGQRKSLFRKIESGPLKDTPKILAHLFARQVEEAGGEVPGVRGMPLGLPSMPPADIQLVESWIAQGRPE